MLENTVTTFVQSKDGHKLSSRRVLFHLPERLNGYNSSLKEVLQVVLSPVSVALCPTPVCVRKCVFCSNSNRNKENCDKKIDISSQKFAELVNSLSRLNVMGVSVAGGGDPLSYKGPLVEKLIFGVNHSFKIGLHTNGVLLEKILNEKIFKGNNLAYINLSVIAHTPELYAKVCGSHPEQFHKIEKNIIASNKLLNLTESKMMFGVKILLCRENLYFIHDMVYYFRRLGIGNILIRCVGNFEQGQDVELYPDQIVYLIDVFKELGMSKDQITAVIGSNSESVPKPSRCWICALQYTAGVDPDGEVYLCSPWSRKEYSIGNINQLDLCKIWGSDKHRKVASKLNDNLQSGKCNPLLCRHYYSNIAIDAFVLGLIKELPKKDIEKSFGMFV